MLICNVCHTLFKDKDEVKLNDVVALFMCKECYRYWKKGRGEEDEN